MITENLLTLKIHKLTQSQYDRELAAGNLDPNALYLTPDEETISAPVTSVNGQTGDVVIDVSPELPAVTATDNGKFLRVSTEGKWVAQTILNAEEVAF